MHRFHHYINENCRQNCDQETYTRSKQKPAQLLFSDVSSGFPDILFQQILEIENRVAAAVVQLLRHLMNNEISFQLIIAGRATLHMIQELLQFIYRKLMLNITAYHSFCSTAIHIKSLLSSVTSTLRLLSEKSNRFY